EELDSLTNSVEGIASAAAAPVTGAEPMSPPPLDRPLGQVAIEPPAGNRLVVAQPRVAQNPSSATAELSPVVAGSMLLINDNRRVYALDRISGRLRWAYRHQEASDQTNPAGVSYGVNRVVQDQRAVLVQGDGVYAVLGFAAPWQGRRRQFVHQPTQLVGLDRDSGHQSSVGWCQCEHFCHPRTRIYS
ncbi:MAG: hypothetical protein AAF840_15370, partial [Bacteroidota bacterium]